MEKKYKDLTKNTLLFLLSSFVPKVISFLLVPLYTSYLSTADYGVSDLLNSTVYLLVPITTLSIGNAVLRFTLNKKYDQKDCLNIALRIVFYDTILLAVITAIQLATHIVPIDNSILFFFDVLMILESLYDVLTSYCKGTDRVKAITISSIVNSLVTVSMSILFIAILKMGLVGLLLANTIGLFISNLTCVMFGKIYREFSMKISLRQVRPMLIYSIPMILSTTAWWINNASDRYIISMIAGVTVSGVYAVASKIPAIIFMAQNVFSQAWSISAIKEYDKDDKDGFIGTTFSLLSSILCLIGSCIIILNIPLSTILFQKDFFVAWQYVPLLSVSVVIDGFALFIGSLFFAVNDTKSRAAATVIGAVINTVLNFILIPVIGAFGAAIATVVGFSAGYIYSRIKIRKYIKIKTNIPLIDTNTILLIAQAALASLGNRLIIAQVIILAIMIVLNRKNILVIISKIISGGKNFIKQRAK